jgi:hypothetical protein
MAVAEIVVREQVMVLLRYVVDVKQVESSHNCECARGD